MKKRYMQLGKSYGNFQNTILEIQPFSVKKITKKYMTFTENYRPRAAARPRGFKTWAKVAAAAF